VIVTLYSWSYPIRYAYTALNWMHNQISQLVYAIMESRYMISPCSYTATPVSYSYMTDYRICACRVWIWLWISTTKPKQQYAIFVSLTWLSTGHWAAHMHDHGGSCARQTAKTDNKADLVMDVMQISVYPHYARNWDIPVIEACRGNRELILIRLWAGPHVLSQH